MVDINLKLKEDFYIYIYSVFSKIIITTSSYKTLSLRIIPEIERKKKKKNYGVILDEFQPNIKKLIREIERIVIKIDICLYYSMKHV